MLTEMHRKGGSVCQGVRDGTLHCPLIVRPTSEDVITGHLVQALRVIEPRRWLPNLLNQALGVQAFSGQFYRDLRIEPWVNKPSYPRELLYWDEGSTQVDFTISWENPATTVFVEMKYWSELSATTSRNQGQHGFPSDQLTRNVRVGLLECGYFQIPRLFEISKRDFLQLVITPDGKQPLVAKYRNASALRSAIPHSHLIPKLPRLPFLGELSYHDVVQLFQRQRRRLCRSERVVADQMAEYLTMKLAQRPSRNAIPPQSAKLLPMMEPCGG